MDQLRTYMERKGITQAQLAELIGVSQPTVCEWLSGRSTPSTRRLITISKKTGLSVDQLLKGTRPC